MMGWFLIGVGLGIAIFLCGFAEGRGRTATWRQTVEYLKALYR